MKNEVESTEYLDRQRRGRLMLLCMLIFFITPIIAVMVMYKLDWRPKGESIGELITPAVILSTNSALVTNDGTVAPPDIWKDKWSMVYVSADCETTCKDKLHIMRQLHISLYKEIPRMQRVLITTTGEVAELKQRYPELMILNQPAAEIKALSEQFNINHEPSVSSDRIYLVDP